jgi:hypothetical protein
MDRQIAGAPRPCRRNHSEPDSARLNSGSRVARCRSHCGGKACRRGGSPPHRYVQRLRACRAGLPIVQMAVLVTVLTGIRRRPALEIHGSDRLWTAAAFLYFVGPVA